MRDSLISTALGALIALSAPLDADEIRRETWPLLGHAITSFGACEEGGWLYVYGGHTGRAHEHSRDNLSRSFRRLNLADGVSWEDLPMETSLQSVALVPHGSHVFRVGGLDARNARFHGDDLWSVDEVSRFDPEAGTWESWTPLPRPLSSHDAVVLGDRVFVVGGWTLAGKDEEPEWSASILSLDLSRRDAVWREHTRAPLPRRALALATTRDGRILAIGGMTEAGEMSHAVDAYEPGSDTWTALAAFPGVPFGVAAVGTDEGVLASGIDGSVYRLAPGDTAWKPVAELVFPRFFHRLVATRDRVLAIGGATSSGHSRSIEPLHLEGAPATWATLDVPWPGAARSRQGWSLREGTLLAFGGNTSLRQHDFARDDFTDEVVEIDLANRELRSRGRLPRARQSLSVVTELRDRDGSPRSAFRPRASRVFALGGFGPPPPEEKEHGETARDRTESSGDESSPRERDAARTWSEVLVLERGDWREIVPGLPEPISQAGVHAHEGTVWVLGGLDFDGARGEDAFRIHDSIWTWRTDGDEGFSEHAARLPAPRRAFASARLDGKIHVVGGMGERFERLESCHALDLATATWESIPSPSHARLSADLIALDGALYLVGGSVRDDDARLSRARTIERYDPLARRWEIELESMPIEPLHARAFAIRGRLLVVSTHNDEGVLRIGVYSPARSLSRAAP